MVPAARNGCLGCVSWFALALAFAWFVVAGQSVVVGVVSVGAVSGLVWLAAYLFGLAESPGNRDRAMVSRTVGAVEGGALGCLASIALLGALAFASAANGVTGAAGGFALGIGLVLGGLSAAVVWLGDRSRRTIDRRRAIVLAVQIAVALAGVGLVVVVAPATEPARGQDEYTVEAHLVSSVVRFFGWAFIVLLAPAIAELGWDWLRVRRMTRPGDPPGQPTTTVGMRS